MENQRTLDFFHAPAHRLFRCIVCYWHFYFIIIYKGKTWRRKRTARKRHTDHIGRVGFSLLSDLAKPSGHSFAHYVNTLNYAKTLILNGAV